MLVDITPIKVSRDYRMGFMAERFGTHYALISGGVMCVIAVGIVALLLPKFFMYNGREGIRQRE